MRVACPPVPVEGGPSAHLTALRTAAKLKARGSAAGLFKRVITQAGELGTEFSGVGLATESMLGQQLRVA